ncbi:hypothetical protein [Nannocystis punicea]|uniref:Uncharacterized protein n=1 Tax=Nannocystis punicea TaxID=2995304 RepID=A0ABY7GYP4_9BACT|nr:hypothetical protein [Nannocystis poenicansa]WAS92106.1 hypothetical protein O0S08_38480 [Nannocystis poenicansa]
MPRLLGPQTQINFSAGRWTTPRSLIIVELPSTMLRTAPQEAKGDDPMLFFNCIQSALFSAVTAFAAPDVAEPDEITAPNDEFVEPADENTDDGVERRSRYCSASADYGRQLARVWNSSRDPSVCLREKLGGRSDRRDCWSVGREIGCEEIVDVN